MLLSKKTSIKVSREYANLIGHMCYAASKLWNVCNYERQHYKEAGMGQYPDWYYQKKPIKRICGINSSRPRLPRKLSLIHIYLCVYIPRSRIISSRFRESKSISLIWGTIPVSYTHLCSC